MRVQLRRQLRDSKTWWRLTEADGELVTRWLPNEGPSEPLDRGGYQHASDAIAFKLGIDWVRARAGVLGEVTTADIDLERAHLDQGARVQRQLRLVFEAV